jgi:hypothetical protein
MKLLVDQIFIPPKTIPMKNDNRVFLHTLPTMTQFTYRGKNYRTIVPVKEKVMSACHGKKTEVMDLKTFKTKRFLYFTRVLIFSE